MKSLADQNAVTCGCGDDADAEPVVEATVFHWYALESTAMARRSNSSVVGKGKWVVWRYVRGSYFVKA